MALAAEVYDFIKKELITGDDITLEDRYFDATISSIRMDRDREIVLPRAFEKHLDIYLKNPVLLLFHQHRSLPIGKCIDIKISDDRVVGRFYIAKTQLGDEVLSLIKDKCLNGLSAGFVPLKYEENPPIQKIPHEALVGLEGIKPKKIYYECEIVEISLLPIPSNRLALIERAEKGNSVANLIVKSFDIEKHEDLDLVIKEWMDSKKSKYTLKSLLKWEENEHPRDSDGKFTESSHVRNVLDPIRESNYYPSEVNPRYDSTNRAANQTVKRVEESNQKLDKVIDKQDEMIGGVKKIKDNTSWKNWFTKYAIGIATAVGGYMLWKHGHKVFKGYDEGDKKALSLLGTIQQFLTRGEELGLSDSIEYKKIKKFYDTSMKSLSSKESKGLSSIYVVDKGYFYTIAKEMSSEEFVEEEHPRHADGKFRKKTESSKSSVSVVKNKPSKAKDTRDSVDPDDHIPVSQSFKNEDDKIYLRDWAKKHKNKLFVAAGVASFPLVFTTARFGGRLFKAVYSDAAKRTVPWDKLSLAERKLWRSKVEPGDIFLQGGKAPDGMSDFIGDVLHMKNDGDANNRVSETLIKAINGNHYGHSGMIAGSYDLTLHQRACDDLIQSKRVSLASSTILGSLEDDKKRKFVQTVSVAGSDAQKIVKIEGVGKVPDIQKSFKQYGKLTKLDRDKLLKDKILELRKLNSQLPKIKVKDLPTFKKKIQENRKVVQSLKILDKWDDFRNGKGRVQDTFGQFLIAATTNKADRRTGMSPILLYVSDHPLGGKDTTGAILRTKVDKKARIDMCNKLIDSAFANERHPITYSMGLNKSLDVKRLDTFLKKVGDPATAKTVEVFLKDDKVLCSGAIAKFYKIFGNIDTDREAKYLYPSDLLKDSKLGGMILEAGKKDWISASDVLDDKRAKRASRTVVAGVGTVGAGTVAYAERDKIKERAEEYKKKFVKKAMSAEEFEESEHPRDSDGKFTESGKSNISTSKDKIEWGGKREFSGRLPKEAHNAVPRLREKYKKQNPEASDQDIDNMVKKYAEDNLKPDIHQFIENPERYWADQDQKRKDALMTKYNSPVSRGQRVSPVNSSKDIDEIQKELNTAKGEFEQELQKTQIVKDAWDTIRDKDSDTIDKNRARLIMAAAGVASLLGVALILRKMPNINNSRLTIIPGAGKEFIEEGGQKLLKGTGSVFERSGHNFFQFNKLVRPSAYGQIDSATELKDANFLNRWMSTAYKKFRGQDEGSEWAMSLGSKWHGFRGRFRLQEYFPVDTKNPAFNFDPQAGIMDKSGRILYAAKKTENLTEGPIQWKNILRSHNIINGNTPTEYAKMIGLRKTDDNIFEIEDKTKFIEFLTSPQKDGPLKGAILAKPITGKTKNTLEELTYTEETFPKVVLQKRTTEDLKQFEEEMAGFPGWAEFLEEEVVGPVSRKTLAGLAVAGPVGATAAYLTFYKDIKKSVAEMKRDRKAEAEQESAADKAVFAKPKGGSGTSEVARINALAKLSKAEQKREEAAAKRDLTSTALETARGNTRDKLITLNVRRPVEGSNNEYLFTPDTLYDRLKKQGRLDSLNSINEIHRILDDSDKREKFLDEIAKEIELEKLARRLMDEEKRKKDTGVPDIEQHVIDVNRGFEDIIIKMMEEEGNYEEDIGGEEYIDFDLLLDAMADEAIDQITKISKCCRTVIDSGLPGHTDYEDINTMLAMMYRQLKDKVEGSKDESEINEKSLDTSSIMSSTIDAHGGVLVGEKKKDGVCKVCGRFVTEEDVFQCENVKCPYDFTDIIETKE